MSRPPPTRAIPLMALLLLAGCPTAPGPGRTDNDSDADTDLESPEVDTVSVLGDADDSVSEVDRSDGDESEVAAACPTGCDDGNPCTDDRCGASGCEHIPNLVGCDDGEPCTHLDRCRGGACVGEPLPCDDDNTCTTDACVDGECHYTARPGPCDDSDACTVFDTCSDGRCVGTPRECPASVCADATCDARTGCGLVPRTGPCDDHNACTQDDTCRGDICVGVITRCDDHDPCTDDYCDPVAGCVHRPNLASCDDGDPCTGPDRCMAGTCHSGPATECCASNEDCASSDPCVTSTCSGGRCRTEPRCRDGDACTADGCALGICSFAPWSSLFGPTNLLDDFESTPSHWQFESTNPLVSWHRSTLWSASGTSSLALAALDGGAYDHGRVRASARRNLSIPPGATTLRFQHRAALGDDGSCIYDVLEIRIVDALGSSRLLGRICSSGQGELSFALDGTAPGEYSLELLFDTRDDANNDGAGLFIDDLRLDVTSPCP